MPPIPVEDRLFGIDPKKIPRPSKDRMTEAHHNYLIALRKFIDRKINKDFGKVLILPTTDLTLNPYVTTFKNYHQIKADTRGLAVPMIAVGTKISKNKYREFVMPLHAEYKLEDPLAVIQREYWKKGYIVNKRGHADLEILLKKSLARPVRRYILFIMGQGGFKTLSEDLLGIILDYLLPPPSTPPPKEGEQGEQGGQGKQGEQGEQG